MFNISCKSRSEMAATIYNHDNLSKLTFPCVCTLLNNYIDTAQVHNPRVTSFIVHCVFKILEFIGQWNALVGRKKNAPLSEYYTVVWLCGWVSSIISAINCDLFVKTLQYVRNRTEVNRHVQIYHKAHGAKKHNYDLHRYNIFSIQQYKLATCITGDEACF